MIEKLEQIEQRWKTVEEELSKPDVVSDMKRFTGLNKEYKELTIIVEKAHEYKRVTVHLEEAKTMMNSETDEEMREMAKEEYEELLKKKTSLEEEIKLLLVPKDPEDAKHAIIEIRSGTGGDEASLFAGDLYRMYVKYCEDKKWKISVVDVTPGTVGGYKELVMEVEGSDVYGTLKYESGVHRVQRIPDTETQGRVHTSAATVAVLPEVDDFDIELNPADIRKDLYCSSGPGGQSVNTTYSAVRLTHIPTGVVAQCQDQKSQIKNFDKAMQVLRSRIYEIEYRKKMEEIAKKRKTMVSTGDRSAKVRTYNFPQGRVTDHRIGLTLYNLQNILDGDINEIISALQFAENAEKIKEGMVSIE